MPTNKPKVQAILTQKYYEKLLKIADEEGRSVSQATARIIEKYIDNYEETNGKIKNLNIVKENNGNVNIQ